MNKIVCNVCGTSYPENASQCPICGFARSPEGTSTESSGSTYTYVKGGRFSKSNVQKRNRANQIAAENPVAKEKKSSGKKRSGAGTVILIIVLLLAIIAVGGYIALRFFLPNDYIFEGLDNLTLPTTSQEAESVETDPPEATEPSVEDTVDADAPVGAMVCTSVSFEQSEIHLESIGSTFDLSVHLEPLDTTDPMTFASSDVSVVTVDEYGTVTSVGEGSAVITVTCGTESAECTVICTVPSTEPEKEKLTLNRKEITFNIEGQSWLLYDGDIAITDIVWTSDDNKVATIENGKVTAVGNGDTTVYGVYEGQTANCIIHCDFDEEGTGDTGGISEAGGDAKRTYSLYNPTGYADDVTINVGDTFTLKLVDENKKEISDAEWVVKNEKICSYKDNTVEGLKAGTTEITATYEGTAYTCVVRVN